MGREIRRVPADWQHPVNERCPHGPRPCTPCCYRPLYDDDYQSAAEQWMAGYAAFVPDKHSQYFWEYEGPPDSERYRARRWTSEEATHYQVYETVSEGTPVSPSQPSKEALVDYLVGHGDFWDQRRGVGGWSRESAERFVKHEWAPSMIVERTATSVSIKEPRDT